MGSSPSTEKHSAHELESYLKREIQNGDTKLLALIKDKVEFYQLYKSSIKPLLLHYAALQGNEEWVKFLIDQKFNVDNLCEGKETSLHSCIRARRNCVSCVKILLKAKANINALNVWGRSPLMEAIVQFKFNIVDYLLSEGADVNLGDNQKTTPLHVCASYGNLECLKTMLAKGANQNAQDERGRTSLYFAINGNHDEVVHFLIKNGCNVNLYDPDFGSPLQKTLTMSKSNLVYSLLKVGASTELSRASRLDNMRLSLAELAIHTVQRSLEACPKNDINNEDGNLSGPTGKALRHIHCFQLIIIAHGFPIQKNISDRLKHIVGKCKIHVLKNELLKLQHLVSSVTKPNLNRGPVDSLQNLARFQCRKYLMASRRNVIWACDQIDVLPVLMNIITLKL